MSFCEYLVTLLAYIASLIFGIITIQMAENFSYSSSAWDGCYLSGIIIRAVLRMSLRSEWASSSKLVSKLAHRGYFFEYIFSNRLYI